MSRQPGKSPQRPQGGGGGRNPQRPTELPQRPVSSEDQSKEHTLHFLFDRPAEPVFLPKGDENAVFDIPTDYIVSGNDFFVFHFYFLG